MTHFTSNVEDSPTTNTPIFCGSVSPAPPLQHRRGCPQSAWPVSAPHEFCLRGRHSRFAGSHHYQPQVKPGMLAIDRVSYSTIQGCHVAAAQTMYINGTLANGTNDRNLRFPSSLILTHGHVSLVRGETWAILKKYVGHLFYIYIYYIIYIHV